MKNFISFLLIFFLVVSCASTGNKSLDEATEEKIAQQIVEGETTKEQVRAMYGSPFSVDYTDEGLEIYKYERSKLKADWQMYIPYAAIFGAKMSGVKKQLVIMFDENSIVKRISMSESDTEHKSGIFNIGN